MDATIVLNKDAVNALFPEGTEIRVEVAKGAVKSLIDATIKPGMVTDEVFDQLMLAKRQLITELLDSNYGITKDRYGKFSIDPAKSSNLNELVRIMVERTMGDMVHEFIKLNRDYINTQVESKVNSIIDEEVKRRIRETVNSVISSVSVKL